MNKMRSFLQICPNSPFSKMMYRLKALPTEKYGNDQILPKIILVFESYWSEEILLFSQLISGLQNL